MREKGGSRKCRIRPIEDLYVSPAVKRQIWQTLQIIQEN